MTLDTETTGLYSAEIVEIAAIDLEGTSQLSTLVKPETSIPAKGQRNPNSDGGKKRRRLQ